jgi:hypothetical protein
MKVALRDGDSFKICSKARDVQNDTIMTYRRSINFQFEPHVLDDEVKYSTKTANISKV